MKPQSRHTDFTVVVPAFNEEPVVPDLVRELREAFAELELDGEVVLVDDGSTDGTAEKARTEAADWPRFRVVSHPRNLGKTEAMMTGVEAASHRRIILFDADLQHSPTEIPRFLEKMDEGWDIVTGRRVGKYQKPLVSTIYNGLSRLVFRVPVRELNSGMKAFDRKILDGLVLRHDWHRFFVVMAWARGASATEIDIPIYPRRAGVSKYTGLWRVVVGLMDLVSVGFLLFFSRKPLLLFGASGMALVGIGAVAGAVAVYLRFVHAALGFSYYEPSFGLRPLLWLAIGSAIVGVVLAGFGILSEQIAHLRAEIERLGRAGVDRRPRGTDPEGRARD